MGTMFLRLYLLTLFITVGLFIVVAEGTGKGLPRFIFRAIYVVFSS